MCYLEARAVVRSTGGNEVVSVALVCYCVGHLEGANEGEAAASMTL